jgi:SnoaL-like domain
MAGRGTSASQARPVPGRVTTARTPQRDNWRRSYASSRRPQRMTRPRNRVGAFLGLMAVLLTVLATGRGASAQELDPASVINAYLAALNAHDAPAALELFDQYGSATDLSGRHFEGRDGLLAFLQTSGFGTPDAQVSTRNLHIVANRAVWTYTCSCVEGPLEARVVTNHGKITVFAVNRPAGYARPGMSPGGRPDLSAWLFGLGVLALGVVVARHLRQPRFLRQPSAQQGRLMAALRAHRAPECGPRSPAGLPRN